MRVLEIAKLLPFPKSMQVESITGRVGDYAQFLEINLHCGDRGENTVVLTFDRDDGFSCYLIGAQIAYECLNPLTELEKNLGELVVALDDYKKGDIKNISLENEMFSERDIKDLIACISTLEPISMRTLERLNGN